MIVGFILYGAYKVSYMKLLHDVFNFVDILVTNLVHMNWSCVEVIAVRIHEKNSEVCLLSNRKS